MTISLGTVFKLAMFLVVCFFVNESVQGLSTSFDNTVSKVSAREAAIATAANY